MQDELRVRETDEGPPFHQHHALLRALRLAGFVRSGWHPYCLNMAVGEPTVHDHIAQGLKEHQARKGMRFNILVTAVEVGGSIALFHFAQGMGATDVVSYLIGSIAPLVGGLMVWVKARKFSGASAAIFSFTALSAVIALIGSHAPKVLLYKDCAVTALIGLPSWARASWSAGRSCSTWPSAMGRTAPTTG